MQTRAEYSACTSHRQAAAGRGVAGMDTRRALVYDPSIIEDAQPDTPA
jgi:hypothetical protein